MAEHPEPTTAAAAVERRIVTVLFADLVGFTPLSERLDAEDVATIQDAYFASVRETIERYGGTLEKFIGDAAMAVFGAPRSRDDDAERAVRAGMALIGAVERLAARLGLAPGELQLRVGVNSGEVVHAMAGPDEGRVTGDTVNTSARLQAAADPDTVLMGELTALAVREAIDLADVGGITLKGKAEPARASRAIAVRPEPSRDAALGDLRAPLLGRADELARLEAQESGRVTIIAPPGVGKSRLVAELAARAEAGGRRVLRARVRPQSASPYESVGQLLVAAGAETRLTDAVEGLPPERRSTLEREVEMLLRAPTTDDAASARDVSAEREVRFAAWSEALLALTHPGPAVWIIEDIHWAGGDLLAFLDHPRSSSLLILCTARPSVLDSAAEWVAAGAQLELSTLPATDAGDLVRALVGDALPDDLVTAIAERSDGNPLFIEELLRTWISVGTLVHEGTGWRLALDPGQVTLPATVQGIYSAQLDDLPPDARLVARHASVAGRRFADAALVPLELADRREGLEVLRRRAFVAGPQADAVSGDVYAYRHALLRDAGYASLARVERARLHAALARWLEETAGDRVAGVAQLVAEHYADAADSVPAIGATDGLVRERLAQSAAEWFERAAEAALAMAAPDAASRLLHRSLELTAASAFVDLARRRLRRGEVLAESAELDLGINDMTAALEALTESLPGAAVLYAEAAYHLGLAYMQQVRFPEAEELTQRALALLTDADHAPGTARLMALHAWAVATQGRDEGVADEARRARDIGASIGDPVLEVDLLEHYAATTDELDMPSEGVWDELHERALAAGRWRQAAIAGRVRALLLTETDPRAALILHDESAELARAHGLTEQQGWADLGRAETRLVTGDWDAALEAGERAIALGERYAYERLVFRTWMVVLPMLAARGDPSWLPRHAAWWGGAIAHFPATASPYGVTLNAATALWKARARGEDPGDGDLPTETPPFVNPHFVAAREIITEAFLARGDLDGARALADAVPDDDWTALMLASQALLGAWVASAQRDRERAEALATTAADQARTIGATWWLARALAVVGPSEELAALNAGLGLP